jgi:hypothetical protein
VAKRKLNYRFHNPNPVEVTADYILKVMIEANTEKVEKILQENMVQTEANECELEYDNPTKKRDKYAEYHFFRMVIFYTHAEKFLELQQYNEAIQALMDAKECLGASKIFKHADLVHIVDSDHKYTVASKGGQAKAEKEAERKAPIYKKLEQYWDKGDWTNQKKKYSRFAEWAIHSEENEGLGYEAIRKYMSKYDKEK